VYDGKCSLPGDHLVLARLTGIKGTFSSGSAYFFFFNFYSYVLVLPIEEMETQVLPRKHIFCYVTYSVTVCKIYDHLFASENRNG
jgi:hypothetical protein